MIATATPRPTPRPASVHDVPAALIDDPGAAIFAANCIACHGESGRGDGPSVQSGAIPFVPDFTDPHLFAGRTEEEVYDIITQGRLEKYMPPWGGMLSEADRRAVARFIYGWAARFEQTRSSDGKKTDS